MVVAELRETEIRELVEELLGFEVQEAKGWILPLPLPRREQGWKLHVSATILSATEVLRRVVPVLTDQRAAFKVAASFGCLADLNSGAGGYSQVGKFITVYPDSDESAVAIAKELEKATRGLAGPRVPTDQQLNDSSIVSYRYGGFSNLILVDDLGQITPACEARMARSLKTLAGRPFSSPSGRSTPLIEAALSGGAPLQNHPSFPDTSSFPLYIRQRRAASTSHSTCTTIRPGLV